MFARFLALHGIGKKGDSWSQSIKQKPIKLPVAAAHPRVATRKLLASTYFLCMFHYRPALLRGPVCLLLYANLPQLTSCYCHRLSRARGQSCSLHSFSLLGQPFPACSEMSMRDCPLKYYDTPRPNPSWQLTHP